MAKEGLKTTRNGAANLQLSPTSSALRSPPQPVSTSSSSLSDFLASLVDCSNFAVVKRMIFSV
jgi:hypothetical protein